MPRKPRPASGVAAEPVYGDKVAQQESLRAVPLPSPRPVVPLNAPTQRPTEPVTSGLPVGPGAGREALMFGGGDPLELARAALLASDDLDTIDLVRYLLDEDLLQ